MIPSPETIRSANRKDLLALGAQWFEAEARRLKTDIEVATSEYGSQCIGEAMHARQRVHVAMAGMLRTASEEADGNREGFIIANALSVMLRTAFTPVEGGAQ